MDKRRVVLLLFLAALAFRLLLCFLFSNEVIPGGDQMQEIMLGRRLASGEPTGVLDTYWAPFYPILIGMVSFFIDSPVIPAAIVSLLASSLIVPLTYLFVAQSYGRRAALIAGVTALFFPHFINALFVLGSENVFVSLMLGVLIVSWDGMRTGSLLRYFAAGILLGFAYLTRPEAIGYTLYFAAMILVLERWRRKRPLKAALTGAAAFVLGTALLAGPYIVYLRGETGRWTVSGKAEINTLAAELSGSANDRVPTTLSHQAKEFSKYFLLNLVEVQKMLPVLFPLLLWLFVGLGLFAGAWRRVRRERELFLILFCLVTVAGYAAAVIQLRYFYVLLPVLIGWAARGIVQFVKWAQETAFLRERHNAGLLHPRQLAALTVLAVFFYVLPLNFYMRSADSLWETSGYEERDAGLWLKQIAGSERYIFSASRRPVFYAEGRQLTPRSTDLNEILEEARSRQVEYIVTSERSLKRNPFLKGLDEMVRNDPAYQLVYRRNDHPGYAISIFKLKEPALITKF